MKKYFIKYWIFIIITIFCNTSFSQDAEKVFQKCVNAVGLITDYNGVGSGFFINENTFITNRHVSTQLALRKSVIKLKDGTEVRVIKKLFEDSSCDLAALETSRTNNFLTISNDATAGEKVYAIGNPTSTFNIYEFTITDGIINNITYEEIPFKEYPISAKVILHSATLNRGNSGGPLLNSKGELVGINSYIHTRGNNQYIAIHLTELIHQLTKYNINYNSSDGKSSITDNNKTKTDTSRSITDLTPKLFPQKDSIRTDTIQTRKIVSNNNQSTVLILVFIFGGVFIFISILISNSNKKQSNLPVYQPLPKPVYYQPEQYKPNSRYINKETNLKIKSSLFVNGRNYHITNKDTIIGRSENCEVPITDDNFISRHHCKIISTNGFYYITDLFSKNGTTVNGRRVNTSILKDKDIIQIGNTEIIFYKYS